MVSVDRWYYRMVVRVVFNTLHHCFINTPFAMPQSNIKLSLLPYLNSTRNKYNAKNAPLTKYTNQNEPNPIKPYYSEPTHTSPLTPPSSIRLTCRTTTHPLLPHCMPPLLNNVLGNKNSMRFGTGERQDEELVLCTEQLYEGGYCELDTVSNNSVMSGYARLLEHISANGGNGGGVGVKYGSESVTSILKRIEDLSSVTPTDYNDEDNDTLWYLISVFWIDNEIQCKIRWESIGL